jgi:hypothetical protein
MPAAISNCEYMLMHSSDTTLRSQGLCLIAVPSPRRGGCQIRGAILSALWSDAYAKGA